MKDKLHFLFLATVIIWAFIAAVLFAAKQQPKRSIGSAVVVALCTLRASRLWDEMKEEAIWSDLKRHPRL